MVYINNSIQQYSNEDYQNDICNLIEKLWITIR
jgi:hypothetical protein